MVKIHRGFPGSSAGKESACSAGDPSSTPGSGRSLGEGIDYPLQYSCLGNPQDRGAWWATGHRVTKNQTRLKRLSTHACILWPPDAKSWFIGKDPDAGKDWRQKNWTVATALWLRWCLFEAKEMQTKRMHNLISGKFSPIDFIYLERNSLLLFRR